MPQKSTTTTLPLKSPSETFLPSRSESVKLNRNFRRWERQALGSLACDGEPHVLVGFQRRLVLRRRPQRSHRLVGFDLVERVEAQLVRFLERDHGLVDLSLLDQTFNLA